MPDNAPFTLPRKLASEFIGTAFLLAAIVGSGIMADKLAGGNDALALLANTLSTCCALIVLISIFGKISGAHFNPLVSLAFVCQKKLPAKELASYIPAQIFGAVAGTMLAHIMFDLKLVEFSSHARTGTGIWVSEVVASFGLLLTIFGCLRSRPENIAYAVGLYIASAYWFTASTSFANPAVTIARTLTNSFAGIRPDDAMGFIMAQLLGMMLAMLFLQWLFRKQG